MDDERAYRKQLTEWVARIVFIVAIGLTNSLYSQQYSFVYYTPRDGLANSRVKSITQDSKGRMYFITFGGLSVYDGVRFINYTMQNGLGDHLVNDIIEITPDSFLVGTNAPVLNTLVNGRIGIYETTDGFTPVINRFHKSNDGTLYLAADEGLFKLENKRLVKLPLTDSNGAEIGANLDRITEWNNYLLFIPWSQLQSEKLIIYNKHTQRVVSVLMDQTISQALVTPEGNLWIKSAKGIQQLDKAALENDKVVLTTIDPFDPAPEWSTTNLYFDHTGQAWLYRSDAIAQMSSSGQLETFSEHEGFTFKNLSEVFVDREGIIWLASNGNGAAKLTGTNVQLMHNIIPGIENDISAICIRSDTTWLFNNSDHAFYRLHKKNITRFPLAKTINTVRFYITGSALYLTDDANLYMVRDNEQRSAYLDPVRIAFDTPVLTMGTGIIDPYGTLIQNVRQDDTTFYLAAIQNGHIIDTLHIGNVVDQLAFDSDKNLWLATRDDQLKQFALNMQGKARYFKLLRDRSKSISGFAPRSIAIDAEDNVWIGTRFNGIYRLRFEADTAYTVHLTMQEGLSDIFYQWLHCDLHNRIWAGSPTGLDKIALQGDDYLVENVTLSRNIFQGIHHIVNTQDNIVWAHTTSHDILQIRPEQLSTQVPLPAFYISSLNVNDVETSLSVRQFAYDQNHFAISIATPSFLDEKSIRYSYWLEGSGQTTWSKVSNIADFNFINLAPGSYHLHLKAEYPAKRYPTQELRYDFIIMPPYWRTWWFISLAILAVLCIASLMLRYYYQRKLEKQRMLLEKKRAIEKERTRISTDMHDDLGAGLSRIRFLSEMIGMKQQQQLSVDQEVQHIRKHAHEMIDKMGEIVWALNEKNDLLTDLLSYVRAYAQTYLSENNLRYDIDKLPPMKAVVVSGEFRRNMFLSVKEALHNIVKHAKAGEVKIQFEVVDDKLSICIQDDGIGFDPKVKRTMANGLLNMRKRMAEIGGELQIVIDNGVCLKLTAPMPV